jgi:pyrimidine-nucleoside phosphorylase/thymidine phosphorylase
VQAIDAREIGLASVALGAGRGRVEDRVDPAVGIVVRRKVGDRVERGEPLCTIHHGERGEAPGRVAARVAAAYRIGPEAPPRRPLVLERMEG